ncbi:hypothetical protein ASD11_11215 [Aeromicrobium sp. Root495]|uniref:bifunctional ADP-dependent NAD(P)H-hydrate dehydratase/NAD(P)H-hydrate epimerase n=1 Tax=Aeromicrobium sp. Root495 TaxID=1736550 RepID=UPI0006F7812F|nr:bifunctional ADP-dependent NAD(P)H-hydrate dehydratase/NAD(P)H-hydrate epimerase [Aeromicrobium sp. Root495]KQY60060.1 hypothetical protein ASD11_11215 [Aeromicrobium sp. Root495]
MLRAHRADDVRAAEQALLGTLDDDGELMARAARGLAEAMHHVPAGEVLLVLVGSGSNGGDALFAAAHLLDRGVRVDLLLLEPEKVHAAGLRAALTAGAQVVDRAGGHRFVLDAIVGIGGRPGLREQAVEVVRQLQGADVTSVDVPSGVGVDEATTGEPHVRARRTVTFGTHKVAGLVDPAAAVGGGTPVLVDIGLGPYLGAPAVEALEETDGHVLARHLFTDAVSHKYTRGVVGVAAGSDEYAGAAHLCVAGAQAGPAGMVRFVGEESLRHRVVDRAPEVVASSYDEAGRVQAWVVGPGGGSQAGERLAWALEQGVPLVVDADALQHLPDRFEVPALLTPHAGELARMLGVERDDVEAEPLAHATRAAEQSGATVLLKGERTLVVRTGAPARVNLVSTPWLGTAGSGDVLAGFAGALVAAGLDPLDAGSVAALLHGRAGQLANPGGPFTASDVARRLPSVVAAFLRGDGA